MEALNSSNPQGRSNSSCVIQVSYDRTIKEEDIPDVSGACIFRMFRSLPDSDRLYSPHFVSIGPFHYGKEELIGMEKSKDEAVRRMQMRIQKKDPHASIKSFVEECLLRKDKEIRMFYGEHIPFTSLKLAWIVARDACFILEFLFKYTSIKQVNEFLWKYDAVFEVNYQNPMRDGLMNDILLFENQIPLWVLKDILQIEMGSHEAGNQKLDDLAKLLLELLNRQRTFMWHIIPDNPCSHVLDILYRGLVGSNVGEYENEEALEMPPSRNSMQIFFEKGVDSMQVLCGRWCRPCLRFPSSNTEQTPSSSLNCMQIWFKKRVDCCKICLGLLSSHASPDEMVRLEFEKLATALELTRAGVKIHPVTFENRPVNQGSAIQWINFDEKTTTLFLPQITVTPQSYLILSNIIAMEVSKGGTSTGRYHPQPMTQYVLFMDELIDNEEDVSMLRKAEVIQNFLGSNQEVAELFNSLATGINPYSWCKVINEARRGLHKYMRRKYKILWSEFISTYFSKPWLVAGSIAAVLLLWMTMAQVLCLFITCNP